MKKKSELLPTAVGVVHPAKAMAAEGCRLISSFSGAIWSRNPERICLVQHVSFNPVRTVRIEQRSETGAPCATDKGFPAIPFQKELTLK